MKCTARNGAGKRCGADAMRGSRRCFWHSPATTQAARDARRRGGQNRMLALRPDAVLVATSMATPEGRPEPPAWWKLEKRDDVLEALREITRLTLARRLDPRTANTALLALRELLGWERERHADRRARREWARMQLRDRLAQIVEELRNASKRVPEGTRAHDYLSQVEGLVEYVGELAARARV